MKVSALALAALFLLGACHNDPFSLKPEVNVTLPDKPADTAPPDEPDDSAVPAEDAEGSQTP